MRRIRALDRLRGALAAVLLTAAFTSDAEVPPTRAVTPEQLATELAAHRGQVILLNAWATWCVPCRKEIPELIALAQELREQGLVLLGLSIDEPHALALVEDFRQRYFGEFRTFLRSGTDLDRAVSVVDPAWNEVVPTTWVIGRDGRVVERIQGQKALADFRAAAQAALAVPAGG